MSTNCEMFEVSPTSDLATISHFLYSYPGPGVLLGKVIELDLEQGDQIEIASANCSLSMGTSQPAIIMCKKGSATGGSDTTLVDSVANFPPGFFNGGCKLVIYAGSGAGHVETIGSNTIDTLTFPSIAPDTIDSTSKYAIVIAGTTTFTTATGGTSVPILTAWDTGTYTIEFAQKSGVSSWGGGRAGYFATQSVLGGGGTIPLNDSYGSTYDSTRDCFWVSDTGDWLVKVDSSGFVLSRTQPAGFSSGGLCYDPVNDLIVFVTSGGAWGTIDPVTATVLGSFGAGGDWHEMTFCPFNNYVYTSSGWVLDAGSGTVITQIIGPTSAAFPLMVPTDNTVWYVEENSTTVRVIDSGTQLILGTVSGIPANIRHPQGAYSPDTGLVYLGGTYAGAAYAVRSTVRVIDPVTRAWVRNFNVYIPSNVASIIFNPVDGRLYMTTQPYGDELSPVIVIDTGTETEVKRYLGPPGCYRTRVSSAGHVCMCSDVSPICQDSFAVLKPT